MSQKIPYLLLTTDYPPNIGGIAEVCYNLAINSGEFLPVIYAGKVTENIPSDFPTIRTASMNAKIQLRQVLGNLIHCLIACFKYQTKFIICGTIYSSLIAFIINKITGIPYYIILHGSEVRIKKNKFKQTIWQKALNSSTGLIHFSFFTKNETIKYFPATKKSKFIKIPMGVKVSDPSQAELERIQKKLNLQNKKVLITICRLEKYKGISNVFDIMPELLKKIPNLVYLVVGKGPYKEVLEREVKDKGLEDHVIFTGYEPEKEPYLALSDVFIMLTEDWPDSEVEGFGIVFLEAGYFKKPCIGNNTGGIAEAIQHNKSGVIVDISDKKNLTNTIQELLLNKTLANKYGEHAYKMIMEECSWKKISGDLLNKISLDNFPKYNHSES